MTSRQKKKVAVFVVSGFLGSGKTSLLQRILAKPEFSDSAVIINELGEVGLDHELVAFSSDHTVVMQGGCVCCTMLEDIEKTLRELFEARDSGGIPPFNRLIIETTGIAEPQPLIFTLHSNPLAVAKLEKPCVVTVVDGAIGSQTLESHQEAVAQIAGADRLVISKRDLEENDELRATVERLNPWAEVYRANLLQDDVDMLFAPHRPQPRAGSEVEIHAPHNHTRVDGNGHAHDRVHTFGLDIVEPLDWSAFGIWMTMLLHRHGENILRVKGLLDIEGTRGPVAFHCAQHLVHPPQHLESWQTSSRGSRLVFVVRDLDLALIERSLKVFNAFAKSGAVRRTKENYMPAGAGGTIRGHPVRRPTAPHWLRG